MHTHRTSLAAVRESPQRRWHCAGSASRAAAWHGWQAALTQWMGPSTQGHRTRVSPAPRAKGASVHAVMNPAAAAERGAQPNAHRAACLLPSRNVHLRLQHSQGTPQHRGALAGSWPPPAQGRKMDGRQMQKAWQSKAASMRLLAAAAAACVRCCSSAHVVHLLADGALHRLAHYGRLVLA